VRDYFELWRQIEKVFDPAKVLPAFAHGAGDAWIRSEYSDPSRDPLEVRYAGLLGYFPQCATFLGPGGAIGPPIPVMPLKPGLKLIPSLSHRSSLAHRRPHRQPQRQCAQKAAGRRRDRERTSPAVSEPLLDFE
jgi:hypothetical protein